MNAPLPPPQPDDWPAFLALAARHEVWPLLYRRLGRAEDTLLPPAVRATLRARYEDNRRHMLLLSAESLRLARALGEAGVPLLLAKGPALAQRLYGDVAMREAKDLDLHVLPQDVPRAESLLRALGYAPPPEEALRTPRQRAEARRREAHQALYHPQKRIQVELHWRFLANAHTLPPAATARFWERSQRVRVGPGALCTLSDADALLYLLLHGAFHQWFRLKWLTDIAAYLDSAVALDWASFWADAVHLGVQRPAAQGLLLAHALLGTPWPEGLPPRATLERDGAVRHLVAAGRNAITLPTAELFAAQDLQGLRQIRYHLSLRRDLPYRAEVLALLWAYPSAWQTLPLPDALFFLYPLLRPLFWLRERARRSRG
jgi:hypothetical protein